MVRRIVMSVSIHTNFRLTGKSCGVLYQYMAVLNNPDFDDNKMEKDFPDFLFSLLLFYLPENKIEELRDYLTEICDINTIMFHYRINVANDYTITQCFLDYMKTKVDENKLSELTDHGIKQGYITKDPLPFPDNIKILIKQNLLKGKSIKEIRRNIWNQIGSNSEVDEKLLNFEFFMTSLAQNNSYNWYELLFNNIIYGADMYSYMKFIQIKYCDDKRNKYTLTYKRNMKFLIRMSSRFESIIQEYLDQKETTISVQSTNINIRMIS